MPPPRRLYTSLYSICVCKYLPSSLSFFYQTRSSQQGGHNTVIVMNDPTR